MSDFKKLSDNECAKLLTALHFFNTHDFTDKSYLDLEGRSSLRVDKNALISKIMSISDIIGVSDVEFDK